MCRVLRRTSSYEDKSMYTHIKIYPQYSLTVSEEKWRHTKNAIASVRWYIKKESNYQQGCWPIFDRCECVCACACLSEWVKIMVVRMKVVYSSWVHVCVCLRLSMYAMSVREFNVYWIFGCGSQLKMLSTSRTTSNKLNINPQNCDAHILSSTIVCITQTQSIHPKHRFLYSLTNYNKRKRGKI